MDILFSSLGWLSINHASSFEVIPHVVSGALFGARAALYPPNLKGWLQHFPVKEWEGRVTGRELRIAAQEGRHSHDIQKIDMFHKKASLGVGMRKKEKAEKLVDALLAEEKRLHEATVAYEAKLQEVLAKKKEELEEKTANELKDLCVSKGLPVGVGKESRIERLLGEAKTSGEADKILMAKAREDRTAELQAEKIEALQKLCVQLEVEPLIKVVMIERLIAHESTFGPIKLDKKGKASKM